MKKIFIILLIPVCLQAQTRFYLNTNVPAVTATLNGNWNVTSGNVVALMSDYVDKTGLGTVTSGQVGAAAVRKVLIKQFISLPLIAQTLNGTLTGQLRMFMNSVSSRTGQGFVYFRILHTDASITEIGTLTTTNLVAATATNRTFIALTLSSVAIVAGDRFVIDIGWNYATGTVTTTTGSGTFTSSAATDLPVDNTTTTVGRPWFEFSQAIKFQYQTNGFF